MRENAMIATTDRRHKYVNNWVLSELSEPRLYPSENTFHVLDSHLRNQVLFLERKIWQFIQKQTTKKYLEIEMD